MDIKDVLNKVEARQQELYELLCELIRIDSVNYGSFGNEKEIAEHLEKAFRELGYEAEAYSPLSVPGITEHPDYYAGRGLENRLNMSARIPGSEHGKRLHLAAHLDTEIIGERSTWTVEPLAGIIKDGNIWGRGACDDKYGIAAALFLIRLFREEGIRLPYDLVFTAYCDEEKGGGNGALSACLKYPSDDCLNLDCKNLEIWAGGSGGGCLSASFATKTPVDSCEKLTEAIQIYREEMEVFRKRRHDELMEKPRFAGSVIPDTAMRFQHINVGGALSLNRARAGICFYTTKEEPEIRAELEEIGKRLQERLDPLDMVFEGFQMTTRYFRFAETAEENPAMELLRNSIREVSGEERDGIGSCLSDLPLFIHYGSPRAFCFGAGRDFGEYGGAHQPDEFIECDKFLEFTKILADFLLNYR